MGIIAFLVTMTEGQNWGWPSPNTIGLLGISLSFFALFLFVESRVSQPMINLTVLAKRNVLFTNVTAFVVGLGMFMMFQAIVYLVRSPPPIGFGSSIFDAGLLYVPGSILLLIAGPLAGVVVSKRGAKLPLVLGSVILSASFLYFYLQHDTKLQVVFGLMVMSFGMGFMMVSTINHHYPVGAAGGNRHGHGDEYAL
jgi:hypothetical protein